VLENQHLLVSAFQFQGNRVGVKTPHNAPKLHACEKVDGDRDAFFAQEVQVALLHLDLRLLVVAHLANLLPVSLSAFQATLAERPYFQSIEEGAFILPCLSNICHNLPIRCLMYS
jgi:hypothetical protein